MDVKKLTRQEKERLYIVKMTELQTRWNNPIDFNWEFGDWKEEELNKGLQDVVGQLRFEKTLSFVKSLFLYPLCILFFLGIIGLLLFGIRQLFI